MKGPLSLLPSRRKPSTAVPTTTVRSIRHKPKNIDKKETSELRAITRQEEKYTYHNNRKPIAVGEQLQRKSKTATGKPNGGGTTQPDPGPRARQGTYPASGNSRIRETKSMEASLLPSATPFPCAEGPEQGLPNTVSGSI